MHLLLQTSLIVPLVKRKEKKRKKKDTFAPIHTMREWRRSKGIAPLILESWH
jgi:hypothetical protein